MQSHDIFISYSREDRGAAQRFAALLADEGFSVWWDAAIHSGETFDEVIERQLRAARAAVVLWSPRSVSSRWVRAEATLADRRKIFVPVIIEPCDLPILFELSHTNDLSSWDGNREDPAWRRLLADLRYLIEPVEQAPNVQAPKRRSFLLSDSPPEDMPRDRSAEFARNGGAAPEPKMPPAPSAPAPSESSETEQTAFYTKSDFQFSEPDGRVHCLEIGPADAPLARYSIGILGAKVGRSAPADIILSDKRISRRHCNVEVKNGELLVVDLQSTNGTFIDGNKIDTPTPLPPDSELRLGDVVLTHRVRDLAELN